MAFTEAQQLTIGRVLGIPVDYLTDLLAYRVDGITSAVEAEVVAELTRWATYSTKFTKIHPTESNKGVETFPEKMQADIRNNIANLLFLGDYVSGGGARLGRG